MAVHDAFVRRGELPDQRPGLYCMPQSMVSPAIDSFIVGPGDFLVLFQMTGQDESPVKTQGLVDVFEVPAIKYGHGAGDRKEDHYTRVARNTALAFVVPPSRLERFRVPQDYVGRGGAGTVLACSQNPQLYVRESITQVVVAPCFDD